LFPTWRPEGTARRRRRSGHVWSWFRPSALSSGLAASILPPTLPACEAWNLKEQGGLVKTETRLIRSNQITFIVPRILSNSCAAAAAAAGADEAVNKELADAKKKAAEAKSEVPAAFNGAYGADLKPFPTKAPSILDKVRLTWGGYFSADAVWREHSTLNDSNTSFAAIPYPFQPTFGENEFRASARQSRISLLVEGPLTATQKLSGYFEMDFQGAAPTANFNQSNSWTPRLRQGFFAYDNLDSGFHFLAGQAWSLVTQTTVDMTPRKENAPIVIDANYIPGFDYTRNWQLRFVQDITPWVSIGASVEAPAALVYAGTGAIANKSRCRHFEQHRQLHGRHHSGRHRQGRL
jgi:hypothetical protein